MKRVRSSVGKSQRWSKTGRVEADKARWVSEFRPEFASKFIPYKNIRIRIITQPQICYNKPGKILDDKDEGYSNKLFYLQVSLILNKLDHKIIK